MKNNRCKHAFPCVVVEPDDNNSQYNRVQALPYYPCWSLVSLHIRHGDLLTAVRMFMIFRLSSNWAAQRPSLAAAPDEPSVPHFRRPHKCRIAAATQRRRRCRLQRLLGGDSLARPIQQRLAYGLYFFFPCASAPARFSFTLNFTILLIRPKGIGLSSGNFTEPFAPS